MFIKCPVCREPISKGWLFLGLPWSTYTCKRCGSVLAGTFLRLVAVSLAAGLLGYVLIGVVKGKIEALWLPPLLLLTLVALFVDFPMQLRAVGRSK